MTSTRRRKIVLLGFDACDADLVRDFVRAGKLPTFRRLLDEWSWAQVVNPFGFFVGAVWTSFFTARSVEKNGFHCWETVTPGYEWRLTSPAEIAAPRFWDALGESGRKAAVIDVPHSRAFESHSVLEISEYGCHDRHFGLRSSNAKVRDDVVSRFGFHPVFTMDPFAEKHFTGDDYAHRAGALRTREEETLFQRDLLAGLQKKNDLVQWVYQKEDWDLFIAVFGESHAVGHQSWYLHDAKHPRHNPGLARSLGDPLEKVYGALDRSLAGLLSTIGSDATVLVLLSHGMQAHYDGTYILEPALARLNSFVRTGVQGSLPGRLVKSGWLRLNDGQRKLLGAPLRFVLRQHLGRHAPPPDFETDIGAYRRAQQLFYMSPNNSVYGGVRVNLKGREPSGKVSPGAEFDAVCEQLTLDLASLINVETGGPVVRSVARTDAYYKRDPADELPDLLIDWNHEAPVETVWSPKTGVIHAPYWHWRTGDHRPGGLLLAKGPNLPEAAHLGAIENFDLGPTICAMLGVELKDVDGRPVQAFLNGE
jgi:predicted AlkP superfamily phosphohydrolase/phosphomutase